jgi:hypothetical protein
LFFMGLVCAMIWQDPQEMAWIEGQAVVFVWIVFLLMFLCVVKGLLAFRARRVEEGLFREGMNWLFSSIEELRGRYRIPRDSERASSSYP